MRRGFASVGVRRLTLRVIPLGRLRHSTAPRGLGQGAVTQPARLSCEIILLNMSAQCGRSLLAQGCRQGAVVVSRVGVGLRRAAAPLPLARDAARTWPVRRGLAKYSQAVLPGGWRPAPGARATCACGRALSSTAARAAQGEAAGGGGTGAAGGASGAQSGWESGWRRKLGIVVFSSIVRLLAPSLPRQPR